MHQLIKDHLEECLNNSGAPALAPEFQAHFDSCPDCAGEVGALRTQAAMLRSLRAPADLEPRPGFYARVSDRIEQRSNTSIWSAFLEPVFGRRLTYASATLAVLLGTYLVSTEPGDRPSPATSVTSEDGAVRSQDRDAVLVSLASYRE